MGMAQAIEKGRVQLVKIDLQHLYRYGVKLSSEKLLELILSQYEADYKILFSASKDIDVIYYDDDFKKYVEEHRSDKDIVELAVDYAEQKRYKAVVWLFDGYEEAVAMIRPRDGDE
jgi:transcription antitermination factor NusA-like protein